MAENDKKQYTAEQEGAINSRGKVIVSASAGSGKTFVMIEKLALAIENGADLDEVLAVTFTKKAAANMKDKLREALIKRLAVCDSQKKARLKSQIAKISSADISTIHSFCARLLRTYFYVLGIDGGFEIMQDGDAASEDIKNRALEELFEGKYAAGDKSFILLLQCLSKKRRDDNLKKLAVKSYARVRAVAHYRQKLQAYRQIYTQQGFEEMCGEFKVNYAAQFMRLYDEVEAFAAGFAQKYGWHTKIQKYMAIFAEMEAALKNAADADIFSPLAEFETSAKPADKGEEEKEAGAAYSAMRKKIKSAYGSVRLKTAGREEEYRLFTGSGEVASAFCGLLLDFDDIFSRIKQEEGKLDYNDLEHYTLELLTHEEALKEIKTQYRYVFVDEYQDVNPVQEEIISAFAGDIFLVGDEKQAIYGFRGSKSEFFSAKYKNFSAGEGSAKKLTGNFRSCGKVISFVNKLFSEVMQADLCGYDYAKTSQMQALANYPAEEGSAGIYVFESCPAEETPLPRVYSVKGAAQGLNGKRDYSAEGLAVAEIVKRELQSTHYDLDKKAQVPTQAGDICVLVRKMNKEYTRDIARALTDAGYAVSGAQEGDICNLPEVRLVYDIISIIDNPEQDAPLVSALLSPMGGLTEEELATVRIISGEQKDAPFRQCCARYMAIMRDGIAQKLNTFSQKLGYYRELSQILGAAELIDKILWDTGLEAKYSADGGAKLQNVLKFASEGSGLTVTAFLAKLKDVGFKVSPPVSAPSNSVTLMTMHSAKGLEFPVVILADITRTFKGEEEYEMPYDEKWGFTPRYYDTQRLLTAPTLLQKLAKSRAMREELVNEINLFYVACTRARNKLYVLSDGCPGFDADKRARANCYAGLFDMSKIGYNTISPHAQAQAGEETVPVAEPDTRVAEGLKRVFQKPYGHAGSVDLPVKSSASAILKSRGTEEYFTDRALFGGEGETGTERGVAYHRFLELCDFSRKGRDEVAAQIEEMFGSGGITEEQRRLLNAEELAEILQMPVFGGLTGAILYREKEFLCRMPACDILNTDAEDGVLVQGAIDLLVIGGQGVRIIDYKYSVKPPEQLKAVYAPQISLYKKAVSKIMGVPEDKIGGTIVNIHLRTQTEV